VTSDGGLILVRELDERLGLEKLIEEHLSDSRQCLNKQFTLSDLLRQSVYSRLADYEDLNDAERLAADPTFRLISSQRIWDRGAALTSTLHWFETELLTKEENLIGLMALNRETLGQAESLDSSDRVVLDMDSSESPVHGEQEGSAYNGHFERSATTRYFCSTIVGTAWRRSCARAMCTAQKTGMNAVTGDRASTGGGQGSCFPGGRGLCQTGDLRSPGGTRCDVCDPHSSQR
jgi:DDE family transposase